MLKSPALLWFKFVLCVEILVVQVVVVHVLVFQVLIPEVLNLPRKKEDKKGFYPSFELYFNIVERFEL